MTLKELRALALDYLQAKKLEEILTDQAQLDRLINVAYTTLVNKIDVIAPYYNVAPLTLVLTTPASGVVREFAFDDEAVVSPVVNDIRRFVDCSRVVVDRRYFVRIVPFAKRNGWLGRPGGRFSPVPPSAVAFYRSRTTNNKPLWHIAFVAQEPPTSTAFDIRYAPEIDTLEGDDNIPFQVSEPFHYLIAIRTALIQKVRENRDASGLVSLYAEGLADMGRELNENISVGQVQII